MLIQEQPLQHWIDHFYGYGSWHARMWFIALEEGGGDTPGEVAEKLGYFYQEHAGSHAPILCDIREMYRRVTVTSDGPKGNLFANLYDYRFAPNAVLHGVWKNLMAFELGYKNEQVSDLLDYQKNVFALTAARQEALIRLYPLPSPHNHAWYYSWLDMPSPLGFLKHRETYQQHVFHSRMQTILANIKAYNPEVVLMYGMENINTLKSSVQQFFEGAKFKMVKAVKRQIPQHHRTDINGTKLIITTQIPALRHNRVETGFDWEMFGRSVSSPT